MDKWIRKYNNQLLHAYNQMQPKYNLDSFESFSELLYILSEMKRLEIL